MTITRRHALQALGVGFAAAHLPGCGDNPSGAMPDASTPGDAPDAGMNRWATGGTKSMTDKATYPDPFAGGVSGCMLTCATTAGPCTAPTTERRDVSDGVVGLPVRLALKIVTAGTCAPIAGAVVEIWHTQRTGVYSGQTPSPGFCSGDDAQAPSQNYFRGTQTTDANGRVDFDTCYPGGYPGRAIHIHLSVSIGGSAYLVTQIYFPEILTTDIYATHPEYLEFGQPTTSNSEDGIFGGDAYVCTTSRMTDGAMMAAKVIAVRAALVDPSCNA